MERLRGRDEDVGRPPDEALSLGGRGVSGADPDPDLGERDPARPGEGLDLREGPLEIPLDVVAEGLQGRDVQGVDPGNRGRLGEEAVERP